MSNISSAHYQKMKNRFRLDISIYLAGKALAKELVTYGELSKKFGGTARGYGDILGGIAIRCYENELPILPVIVVNAKTRLPSVDALLYEDLGIVGEKRVVDEQSRAFAFDWAQTPFGTAA